MAENGSEQISIRSIMTKPVAMVSRKTTVKEAVAKIAKKNLSCVVVADKKTPIGIFTKFDLMVFINAGLDMGKTVVETVMHTPVMSVEETDTLFSAAQQMGRLNVRRFVVVDQNNHLVGIVTNGDVIRALASRALPEGHILNSLARPGLVATPKTTLKKIVGMMVENRASCVVILKNKKPVGIVTDGVFAKLAAKSRKPLAGSADMKMIKKFGTSVNTAPLRDAVVDMTKNKLRELVVLSADGRYLGVVTQRDIVRFFETVQA